MLHNKNNKIQKDLWGKELDEEWPNAERKLKIQFNELVEQNKGALIKSFNIKKKLYI